MTFGIYNSSKFSGIFSYCILSVAGNYSSVVSAAELSTDVEMANAVCWYAEHPAMASNKIVENNSAAALMIILFMILHLFIKY